MRFSNEQLLGKALHALEDVYARARKGAVEPTLELGFLLAFMANHAEERWPFDQFWKEAIRAGGDGKDSISFGRHQSLTAAMNGIYLQLKMERRA